MRELDKNRLLETISRSISYLAAAINGSYRAGPSETTQNRILGCIEVEQQFRLMVVEDITSAKTIAVSKLAGALAEISEKKEQEGKRTSFHLNRK